MVMGLNQEYGKTHCHCLFLLCHLSYCSLLLLNQNYHFLCHCFLLPMLHFPMSRLTVKEQGSGLLPHNLVMGFQPHPKRMEVTHKQSLSHRCLQSMTGFVLLDCHSPSQQYLSSGLGLVGN